MMNSKGLFLSALSCDDTRDVPIFLRDLTLGLDVIDVRTTDVFLPSYDSKLSAKAVVAVQEYTGQDAVVGCIQSSSFNVESFGGEAKYPEYGIPIPLTHPLEGLTELPKGINTEPSGRMLGAVESYRIVRRRLPDVAVVGNVEGPLTKTGALTGMEHLAMLTFDDPGILETFIEAAMHHTMAFLDMLSGNGSIDAVFIAAASDNPDLFGNETYLRFTIPHLDRLARHIHDMDLPMIFHPHGVFSSEDSKEILKTTIATDVDGFQYAEENDPAVITERIGGRCAVVGGVDIVPTLLYGTEDVIRTETLYHLEGCSGGSHIFTPSCSIHRGADLGRVMTMVDTIRGYNAGIR